ncbi:MAG: hypothetical protein KC425_08025 [Anaerolineales bacterium]|nr:hypothetical protein [Anaerolineales bacterium]
MTTLTSCCQSVSAQSVRAQPCGRRLESQQPHRQSQRLPAARLHIRIESLDGRNTRFSINLPANMLQVGLSIARGFSRKLGCLSAEALQARLNDGCFGLLWDACDERNDERIRIYADRLWLN